MVWLQVGFAMVVLSAAIKGVSDRPDRGGPHRRRHRAADLPPHHRAVDQGLDPHRGHHHRHRRPEGVRHRLRDHRGQLRHDRWSPTGCIKRCSASATSARPPPWPPSCSWRVIPIMVINIRNLRRQGWGDDRADPTSTATEPRRPRPAGTSAGRGTWVRAVGRSSSSPCGPCPPLGLLDQLLPHPGRHQLDRLVDRRSLHPFEPPSGRWPTTPTCSPPTACSTPSSTA